MSGKAKRKNFTVGSRKSKRRFPSSWRFRSRSPKICYARYPRSGLGLKIFSDAAGSSGLSGKAERKSFPIGSRKSKRRFPSSRRFRSRSPKICYARYTRSGLGLKIFRDAAGSSGLSGKAERKSFPIGSRKPKRRIPSSRRFRSRSPKICYARYTRSGLGLKIFSDAAGSSGFSGFQGRKSVRSKVGRTSGKPYFCGGGLCGGI